MSTADQYPGPGNDPGASPWGIPASTSPTPAPGGHLPAFGIPQLQQPPPPRTEPDGFQTQIPAPPSMQSPYGAPLQPPGLVLPPRQFGVGVGVGVGVGGGGGVGDDDYDSGAKRRKTLLISSLAAVAVVGVSVALMGGGSSPQHSATLAGAAQGSSTSPSQGGPSSESTGKPDGDTQVGAAQVSGAPVPTDSPTDAASSTAPGQPVSSSGGAKKPTGPASSAAGSTVQHPSTGPAAASPQPAHPSSSSAAPSPAPHSTTPAKPSPSATTPPPPPVTTPKPPPPPSTDCTYLNLPAPNMPLIKQGSPNANAVKQLQCLLKKSMLGIKPLAVDGIWGPDTQSALVAFQQCNNAPTVHSPGGNPPYARLVVDGQAGQQTWADLYFWDNQYFNNVAYYCNGTR